MRQLLSDDPTPRQMLEAYKIGKSGEPCPYPHHAGGPWEGARPAGLQLTPEYRAWGRGRSAWLMRRDRDSTRRRLVEQRKLARRWRDVAVSMKRRMEIERARVGGEE